MPACLPRPRPQPTLSSLGPDPSPSPASLALIRSRRLVHLAVIHEAPAVLLCCLALLPQEVLDIQNNLYQVGRDERLCLDARVCPEMEWELRREINNAFSPGRGTCGSAQSHSLSDWDITCWLLWVPMSQWSSLEVLPSHSRWNPSGIF